MKLFIWREVFCDYTCGIAFAIAKNKEEAMELILMDSGLRENHIGEFQGNEPEIHNLNEPFGTYVFGGG